MGLLKQEINELRILNAKFRKGEVSAQHVTAQLSIYQEISKRIDLTIKTYALGIKLKGSLSDTKLIKDTQQLISKLIKPAYFDNIRRNPCLSCDFLNQDKNNSRCENCDDRIKYFKQIELQ